MKQSKQSRDCKIVQDLLPNYIENLTNEVTNEFIEEHIAHCSECAQMLKDMNGEIKLEHINQEKEIKYLKKIKQKVKMTIAIVCTFVIIIAAAVSGYVYQKSQIKVTEYTFMRASYIKENVDGTIDGNLYFTFIAVFNEKGICISARSKEEGYTKQHIENIKNNENVKTASNEKYGEDSIVYNINTWNGLTKEEVKDKWILNFITEIEEI